MWETRVPSLDREDPLEKETATHSSTLAWKIPRTEESGRLQLMESQRIRHDWATIFLYFSRLFYSLFSRLEILCFILICLRFNLASALNWCPNRFQSYWPLIHICIHCFFFFKIILFIDLFLVVLGLCSCMWVFL